jgi:hypothetical protein
VIGIGVIVEIAENEAGRASRGRVRPLSRLGRPAPTLPNEAVILA